MDNIEGEKPQKQQIAILEMDEDGISAFIRIIVYLNLNNNMEGKNPKKQIALMEMDEDGISAPNWLFEVLAWISRIEMANSQLSFSCKLFKQLCFPKLHGNVKPHKIDKLQFGGDWPRNFGYLRVNCHNKQLPIPKVPPPSYILGFNSIRINFLGARLLEFVQNILPQFNQIKFAITLLGLLSWKPDDKKTKNLKSLLELLAHKISKFIFHDYSARASKFNRLFPGFIQKVNFLCACPIPADFDILFDWLAFPPINGEKHQKILELNRMNENDTNKFVDRLKEEFFNAKEPVNFFIILAYRVAHFNNIVGENEKTGEILTFYRTEGMPNYNNFYLIVRCPKGEEDFWNNEGQRKMRQSWKEEDENETYIKAEIRD